MSTLYFPFVLDERVSIPTGVPLVVVIYVSVPLGGHIGFAMNDSVAYFMNTSLKLSLPE